MKILRSLESKVVALTVAFVVIGVLYKGLSPNPHAHMKGQLIVITNEVGEHVAYEVGGVTKTADGFVIGITPVQKDND